MYVDPASLGLPWSSARPPAASSPARPSWPRPRRPWRPRACRGRKPGFDGWEPSKMAGFSAGFQENHGKIMGKSWENDDNPSFLDFVWHVL